MAGKAHQTKRLFVRVGAVEPIHIKVSILWQYVKDRTIVADAQLQHLKGCALCIRTLGLCGMATSIRQVAELVEEASSLTHAGNPVLLEVGRSMPNRGW